MSKPLNPLGTGCKLNIHKTFKRRPGRLLNVLCTFNLRPVSTGLAASSETYFEPSRTSSAELFCENS